MEEVTFKDSKGNQILGTISIPEQAESVVIISHGFSSSKESKLYVELQNELNKANIKAEYYTIGIAQSRLISMHELYDFDEQKWKIVGI